MKTYKRLCLLLLFSITTILNPAFAAPNAGPKGLFIDLSSGNVMKMRRAFMVGTMIRNTAKVPVTINISLGATRFTDKALPLAVEAIKLRGQSIHDHMKMFIDAGGEIYVCPMCMQANALTKEDLLEGLKVGGPDISLQRMMAPGVKLISY